MAAKKVTTYRAHFDFATKECAERFIASTCGKGVVTEHEVHRCPHCEAPWPMLISGKPYSEEGCREMAGPGAGAPTCRFTWEYCCDATRRDCEGE